MKSTAEMASGQARALRHAPLLPYVVFNKGTLDPNGKRTFAGVRQIVKRASVPFGVQLDAEFSLRVSDDKADGHLISFATYPEGSTKGNDSIETIAAVTLDFDQVRHGTFTRVCQDLRAKNALAWLYTSWSHRNPAAKKKGHVTWADSAEGTESFRVVLPLARPITRDEWVAAYPAILQWALPAWFRDEYPDGGFGDVECKNASQGWLPPCCPASLEHEALSEFVVGEEGKGTPVDVEFALRAAKTPTAIVATRAEHNLPARTHVLTREDLAAYGERQARKAQAMKDGEKTEHGTTKEMVALRAAAATRILEGKSWAPIGQRHNVKQSLVWSLGWWVADTYDADVDATPDGLRIFEASLAAATAEGVDRPTDLESLGQDFRGSGARLGHAESKAAREAEPAENFEDIFPTPPPPTARAIMRAFGSDRSEPYSDEELAAMHPTEKRWILHTDAGYFLRKPGDYEGPFTKDQLATRARDTLAPASSAGVELVLMGKKSSGKPKTTQMLTREYGSVPGRTEFSLYAQSSALEGDVFVQRVARLRDIEPRFDAQIDTWLRLFGGKNAERLLDWVAVFTRLDEPCCGLIATGASGGGKGLLVAGLARHFPSCGVMTFKDAVGPFNAGLCNAPIIFADEDLAVDYGQSAPDELKKAIDARERRVADKNQRAITLRGACRVIIAANNGRVIKFKRQLTEADIAALDARLLLVEPGQDAVDYLKSLGGIDTTNAWVRGDGLAAHALWLRDNRSVTPGARYLVEGQGDVMTLLSAQDIGANLFLRAVLDQLVRGANDPQTVAVRDGGEVWVNETRLMNAWPAFLEKPDDMGTAKATATVPKSSKTNRYAGVAVRQALVRPEVLAQVAKSAGLEELLAAALSR